MAREDITIEEEFIANGEPLEPPPELILAVGEADDAETELFEALSPIGDYSANALNIFVRGLNAVLKNFPGAEEVENFDEDIEDAPLPESLIRTLGMVLASAEDFGEPLTFSFEDLTDDRALKEAAGALIALGDNSAYRGFLRKPQTGIEIEEEVVVEEEVSAPTPVSPEEEGFEEEEEELLLSRLA
tara:strand:- start:358 stop:918 length:561 start_codon:yes stop_codon:yes gene_type:complete